MYPEANEYPQLNALNWKLKIGVLKRIKKKAGLRNNPDYRYPLYLLVSLSIVLPSIIVWLSGFSSVAVILFIIMGWVVSYLSAKLAKPYCQPFVQDAMDEVLAEYSQKVEE